MRFYRLSICIIFLLLFMAGAYSSIYAASDAFHAFKLNQCKLCHVLDDNSQMAKRPTDDIIAACRHCHSGVISGKTPMHPFDVPPGSVTIPAEMPLSERGQITCVTCHVTHNPDSGGNDYHLRTTAIGQSFCRACHKGDTRGGSHVSALSWAHIGSDDHTSAGFQQALDSTSRRCMSCHDGSVATAITANIGSGTSRDFGRFDKSDHPIGVDIETVRMLRQSAHIRPIEAISSQIPLYNGKLGCGSCHNPYSKEEKYLVMSDQGSNLCSSCHDI
jgi:predicted CXXCH cytochrome family protein